MEDGRLQGPRRHTSTVGGSMAAAYCEAAGEAIGSTWTTDYLAVNRFNLEHTLSSVHMVASVHK